MIKQVRLVTSAATNERFIDKSFRVPRNELERVLIYGETPSTTRLSRFRFHDQRLTCNASPRR